MTKTLSIIIPVYNEAPTIDQLLQSVVAQQLRGWKKEIIVVDDGSTDRTKAILHQWEQRVRVIYKEKNEGKGSALSVGFARATGDIILIQDADLEYDPKDYPVLLAPFTNPHVDVVY